MTCPFDVEVLRLIYSHVSRANLYLNLKPTLLDNAAAGVAPVDIIDFTHRFLSRSTRSLYRHRHSVLLALGGGLLAVRQLVHERGKILRLKIRRLCHVLTFFS